MLGGEQRSNRFYWVIYALDEDHRTHRGSSMEENLPMDGDNGSKQTRDSEASEVENAMAGCCALDVLPNSETRVRW